MKELIISDFANGVELKKLDVTMIQDTLKDVLVTFFSGMTVLDSGNTVAPYIIKGCKYSYSGQHILTSGYCYYNNDILTVDNQQLVGSPGDEIFVIRTRNIAGGTRTYDDLTTHEVRIDTYIAMVNTPIGGDIVINNFLAADNLFNYISFSKTLTSSGLTINSNLNTNGTNNFNGTNIMNGPTTIDTLNVISNLYVSNISQPTGPSLGVGIQNDLLPIGNVNLGSTENRFTSLYTASLNYIAISGIGPASSDPGVPGTLLLQQYISDSIFFYYCVRSGLWRRLEFTNY